MVFDSKLCLLYCLSGVSHVVPVFALFTFRFSGFYNLSISGKLPVGMQGVLQIQRSCEVHASMYKSCFGSTGKLHIIIQVLLMVCLICACIL